MESPVFVTFMAGPVPGLSHVDGVSDQGKVIGSIARGGPRMSQLCQPVPEASNVGKARIRLADD